MTSLGMISHGLLRDRRFRSLVSVISVSVAAALLVVSVSASRCIESITHALDNGRLMVQPRVEGNALNVRAYGQLAATPGIHAVYYAQFFRGELDRARYGALAIGPKGADLGNSKFWSATDDVKARWQATKDGAIVNEETLRRFGWRVDQTVTVKSGGASLPVRIVGESVGTNPATVLVHYDYWNRLAQGNNEVMFAIVECTTPDRRCAASDAQRIDETSSGWGIETFSDFELQVQAQTLRSISAVPRLLWQVCLLVIVITLMITASTLNMSLEERRAEFATLRALGFSNARVLVMIVAESTVLCVAGSVIAAAALFAAFHHAGFSLGPSMLRNVVVPPEAALVAVLASTAMGGLVALLPASRVIRHDIIVGLQQGA